MKKASLHDQPQGHNRIQKKQSLFFACVDADAATAFDHHRSQVVHF